MATHLPPTLSPDAVDTLTELAAIITRLRAQQAASHPSHPTATPTATQTPLPAGTTPGAPTPNSTTNNTILLSAKDLPAATDNLKHKLKRARGAMHTLGDVQRTVGQQRAEMERLEERMKRQGKMLVEMQEGGMRFVRGLDPEREEGRGRGWLSEG